jgi:O-antigen ligase
MKPWVRLLPFAVLLFILPFSGTVALRLLALAVGLVVCAWFWHKDGFPQVPAKDVLLLWGGCALLSLATAINPAYSLGEIKNEIGYAMAAYLGFITLTRTREDAGFFVMALILGNLVLCLLALREHFSSDSAYWNERGLAGGSGSYSTYLLALLPLLLWAGCVLPHKHRWSVVSGLIALQLIVAVLVGQRAFWLVFALQTLFALYLLRARGFVAISARRVRAIGVAAVILSVLAIVGAAATRDAVSWTQDPRVTTWPAVAGRILEHPLTGKGFGRQTMKNAYPDLVSREYPQFWHPHNLFLNYGVAMGIPGMIAIVLLFFTLLRKFWELSRADDRIIAMAGICGVLLVIGVVARNLSNDFFQRDLALLFWSIAGMLLGYAQHARSAPRAPNAVPAIR